MPRRRGRKQEAAAAVTAATAAVAVVTSKPLPKITLKRREPELTDLDRKEIAIIESFPPTLSSWSTYEQLQWYGTSMTCANNGSFVRVPQVVICEIFSLCYLSDLLALSRCNRSFRVLGGIYTLLSSLSSYTLLFVC
jgi:hypothetical protein